MSLNRLIDGVQRMGRYTFTREEALRELGQSTSTLDKSLHRPSFQGQIPPLRRGFYAIVPLEYSSVGAVPTEWFIDDLMRFLGKEYYVGCLSAVFGHWDELCIIAFLLVFNAVIGFWQEFKSSSALEALKGALALKSLALRGGKWQEIAADGLVPGDYVRIIQGDIIPTDVKLADGKYLSIDESALTGERRSYHTGESAQVSQHPTARVLPIMLS